MSDWPLSAWDLSTTLPLTTQVFEVKISGITETKALIGSRRGVAVSTDGLDIAKFKSIKSKY